MGGTGSRDIMATQKYQTDGHRSRGAKSCAPRSSDLHTVPTLPRALWSGRGPAELIGLVVIF